MSEYNSKQKKNLLKKLKAINMTNEKDILNMKVAPYFDIFSTN